MERSHLWALGRLQLRSGVLAAVQIPVAALHLRAEEAEAPWQLPSEVLNLHEEAMGAQLAQENALEAGGALLEVMNYPKWALSSQTLPALWSKPSSKAHPKRRWMTQGLVVLAAILAALQAF